MDTFLLPLLMLLAGGYCAPANLFTLGGTVGYESVMNGTIGGSVNADLDGMAVGGTAKGIIGASWKPTVVARGIASIGDKAIAGDASIKADIDNSWEPSVTGTIDRNSNGWLFGLQPISVLKNKILVTPNVQVKTDEDAKALMNSPLAIASQKATPQFDLMNADVGLYPQKYISMPNVYENNPEYPTAYYAYV